MGQARPFDLHDSRPLMRADDVHRASDKLLGLELLRFTSALAVLIFHYRHFAQLPGLRGFDLATAPFHDMLWPVYDYGLYGVQVFWGISGYIFFWKYGAAIHSGAVAAGNFFWLRFSRLYPLHIATLLMVVGLQFVYRQFIGFNFVYPTSDVGLFIRQIFLATDWGPPPPFSFNGPIWSISAEVAVYAAFFLVLRRFAPSLKLCLAVILATLAIQLAGLNWAAPFCATYFFAGGMAAVLRPKSVWPAALALVALIVLCAATDVIGDRDKLPMILLLMVPCLLIILSKEWPLLGRWQRQVQFAGNLTYSSYLLHFPLQLLFAIFVAASGVIAPLTSPLFLVTYLGVTFGLAARSYRLFELPAQSWIRRRTLRLAA